MLGIHVSECGTFELTAIVLGFIAVFALASLLAKYELRKARRKQAKAKAKRKA